MSLKEVFYFIKPYIKQKKKYLLMFLIFSLVISLFQAVPVEVTKRIFDVGFAEKNTNIFYFYH